jgi:hypothetical protein
MTAALIKPLPDGLQVDGLDLLNSHCGCGSASGEAGISDCCFTYSTVSQEGGTVTFYAKATSPATICHYEWGYRVRKDPVEVDVLVHDTMGPRTFPFGGRYPPLLSEWQQRGWETLSQFQRPLEGIGGWLPAWCRHVEAREGADLNGDAPQDDPGHTL